MKHSGLFSVLAVLALALVGANGSSAASGSGANAAAPGPGFISIPAAAFEPREDEHDYYNTGWSLSLNSGSEEVFVAALALPHGATATNMTLYYADDSSDVGDYVEAYFRRAEFGTPGTLVFVTSGNDGNGSASDAPFQYADIDNSAYSYYLELTLGSPNVAVYRVLIEYSYNTSLPLAVRSGP